MHSEPRLHVIRTISSSHTGETSCSKLMPSANGPFCIGSVHQHTLTIEKNSVLKKVPIDRAAQEPFRNSNASEGKKNVIKAEDAVVSKKYRELEGAIAEGWKGDTHHRWTLSAADVNKQSASRPLQWTALEDGRTHTNNEENIKAHHPYGFKGSNVSAEIDEQPTPERLKKKRKSSERPSIDKVKFNKDAVEVKRDAVQGVIGHSERRREPH